MRLAMPLMGKKKASNPPFTPFCSKQTETLENKDMNIKNDQEK